MLHATPILRGLGLRGRIYYSLQALDMVAAALGSPVRAARIWGAEERLREEIGLSLSAQEREESDQLIHDPARLRQMALLRPPWQEGRALTLEQAMELAMEEIVERP